MSLAGAAWQAVSAPFVQGFTGIHMGAQTALTAEVGPGEAGVDAKPCPHLQMSPELGALGGPQQRAGGAEPEWAS